MKNQTDIIRMANAMQKERELQAQIAHESLIPCHDSFAKSFFEVFGGEEKKVKPKRTDQEMIDAGHQHSDF